MNHPTPSPDTLDPTRRFSSRVAHYTRCRPGYPEVVWHALEDETGLHPGSVVADIGSGTGISSELFLKHGNTVFGIEPNLEMRRAAEERLAAYPRFHSIDATAESTLLDTGSIDYVVAAQAFHWFDSQKAVDEFRRILRPNGWGVLLWNSRRADSTPFLRDYEKLLLDFGTDYQQVNHRHIDPAALARLFPPGALRARTFHNQQRFDFDGLRGRLLSSSYVPGEHHKSYEPMMIKLAEIFGHHQTDGTVSFEYDTELYFSFRTISPVQSSGGG